MKKIVSILFMGVAFASLTAGNPYPNTTVQQAEQKTQANACNDKPVGSSCSYQSDGQTVHGQCSSVTTPTYERSVSTTHSNTVSGGGNLGVSIGTDTSVSIGGNLGGSGTNSVTVSDRVKETRTQIQCR